MKKKQAKKHFFNLPDGFCRLSHNKYLFLKACEWKGKIRQHGKRKGKKCIA